jgi:hypothetical protein
VLFRLVYLLMARSVVNDFWRGTSLNNHAQIRQTSSSSRVSLISGALTSGQGGFIADAMIAVLLRPGRRHIRQAPLLPGGVWHATRPCHEGHPDVDWSGRVDPPGSAPEMPERASGGYRRARYKKIRPTPGRGGRT